MSILSFSVRDRHPKDKKIIEWWNKFDGTYERSREVREVLLSHIEGREHMMVSDIGNHPIEKKISKKVDIKMVNIAGSGGGSDEEDLDFKLEGFGEKL